MKKYKLINKKRFFKCILTAISVIVFTIFIIDFIRFPECYLTTWKYQLENEIKAGNTEMIEYYNQNYVANGRELFE